MKKVKFLPIKTEIEMPNGLQWYDKKLYVIDQKTDNIFILNGLVVKNIKLIRKYNLIPVVNNLEQLEKIENFQIKYKIKIKIAIHFDTGMSRLGLDNQETNYLISRLLFTVI